MQYARAESHIQIIAMCQWCELRGKATLAEDNNNNHLDAILWCCFAEDECSTYGTLIAGQNSDEHVCVCDLRVLLLHFALDGDIEWLRVFSTQQPTTRVVLQALARDEASEGSNLGRKFGIATRAGRTQCGWSAKGLTRMTSLCKLTPSCAQIGELDSSCGGVRVGRQNGWPVPPRVPSSPREWQGGP